MAGLKTHVYYCTTFVFRIQEAPMSKRVHMYIECPFLDRFVNPRSKPKKFQNERSVNVGQVFVRNECFVYNIWYQSPRCCSFGRGGWIGRTSASMIERYMKVLKWFVKQKMYLEGSMATCYHLNETIYYFLEYMSKLDPTRLVVWKFHKQWKKCVQIFTECPRWWKWILNYTTKCCHIS